LVVGLGNPGRRYAATRHNVGYMVVDRLADRWNAVFAPSRCQAEVASVKQPSVLLARPTTYMNESGRAVTSLCSFHDIQLDQLLVICDDLDLPVGRLRLRASGGSGGQKGLRSIAQHLGTQDWARLRVGIGRDPHIDPADYVLSNFSTSERAVVEPLIERAADAIECWTDQGLDTAMNRFNTYDNPEDRSARVAPTP
jgi:PTH1 family peptidyl-tRNA hydrolase